jgi:hypothetical protein
MISSLAVKFYSIINIPHVCNPHVLKQICVDCREGCLTKLATKHAANLVQTVLLT